MTRRDFVAGVALASAAPEMLKASDTSALQVGLELYSLREDMKRDVPGTLDRVRQLGFRHVEIPNYYGLSAEDFRQALDRAGLRATALVTPYEALQKDLGKVMHELDIAGARWAILPWIPHGKSFERSDMERSAKDMNVWGARLAEAGYKFAYHPHGYEFRPAPEGTLFDAMATATNRECVKFELDTFWIVWPGQDCVKLMRRYPGRFRLLHLKDLRQGVQTGDLSGQAPDIASVAVGDGIVPWKEVLTIAKGQEFEYYYLEDESPDASRQIPQSLKFLKSIHGGRSAALSF